MLFILPVLQEAQRPRLAPPPLSARLAKPEPLAPASPKVEPPVQPAARPRSEPAPRAVPEPARAPRPPERAPGIETAKPPVDSVFAAPATPTAPAPVAPQPPVASGPDPGTVAQFRLELMEFARRYKKYPRIAQDNNWEGRVELRIAIGENGAISAITVKKSAGRAVLDDEAQAMIRTATSKAAIPPGLRGKAFAVEIPVDFLLKEAEK